jgi:hypothetical protein
LSSVAPSPKKNVDALICPPINTPVDGRAPAPVVLRLAVEALACTSTSQTCADATLA